MQGRLETLDIDLTVTRHTHGEWRRRAIGIVRQENDVLQRVRSRPGTV